MYKDIDINLNNTLRDWTIFQHDIEEDKEDKDEIDFVCENSVVPIKNLSCEKSVASDDEEDDNPLDKYRLPCSKTKFVPNIPHQIIDESNIIIAPGEDRQPISIICDPFCEELAHPNLFPTGRFGYKAERNVHLSSARYFNQRLLNFTQRFVSDSDYIFFAHTVTQHLNLIVE